MSPTRTSRRTLATSAFTLEDVPSDAVTTDCPIGYDSDLYDPLAVAAVHVESTITLTHTAVVGSVAYRSSGPAWPTSSIPITMTISIGELAREGGSSRLLLWAGSEIDGWSSTLVPLGIVCAIMVLL